MGALPGSVREKTAIFSGFFWGDSRDDGLISGALPLPAVAPPVLRKITALAGFDILNPATLVVGVKDTTAGIGIRQRETSPIPGKFGIAINEFQYRQMQIIGNGIRFIPKQPDFTLPLTAGPAPETLKILSRFHSFRGFGRFARH